MKYDFDTVINRKGTNSLKWDYRDYGLPMWVADMDFKTAPEILDALQKRLDHGVFGYSIIPDEWYDAIIGWWRDRHHFQMEREWLVFCTGIVPAISSIVRKLTTPAEKVLLMTPVYNVFFNSVRNNGRNVIENNLLYSVKDGYSLSLDNIERNLSDPQTTLMILCNPHNPIGKIWDRDTLRDIGEMAKKHGVVVISDEIHCDLTDPGKEYVPFASVSDACRDNSITCISPTKAFNLAGIQTSAVSIPNPALRHKVERAFNTDEIAEPNAFAIPAAIAAFTEGGPWLDELREYLFEGKQIAADFFEKNVHGIWPIQSEATYLLWLDCQGAPREGIGLQEFLAKEGGVFLSAGRQYGEAGRNFMRLNIACPHSVLKDGLRRIKAGVDQFRWTYH